MHAASSGTRSLLRSYGTLTRGLFYRQVIPTGFAADVLVPRSLKASGGAALLRFVVT
jgi:hypothetical protein